MKKLMTFLNSWVSLKYLSRTSFMNLVCKLMKVLTSSSAPRNWLAMNWPNLFATLYSVKESGFDTLACLAADHIGPTAPV